MNKFIKWLKSSSSDFTLFIIFLVLLNLVSYKSFARFDLTSPKSYSLSKASKEIVKTLEQPLSVRVFFDSNLPSPYNSTAQYVEDLLEEYKGAANKNFSVYYMDMSKENDINMARDYGLRQLQIQEIKNNEIGFKQAYMGLSITYGDSIELMDGLTSSEGFEYKFTSTISKMINTVDSLAGLGDKKIAMILYISDSIKDLGISGAKELETYAKNAYETVNSQNNGKLSFNVVNPGSEDVDSLYEKYGLQTIEFTNNSGNREKAIIGIVIELDEKFQILPVQIQRSIFGYTISGIDSIAENISESLQTLVSKPRQIGYITGHNELSLNNEQQSLNFANLVNQTYELVEIDLTEEEIPNGIASIIINGTQLNFTEEELYKIDQFIMKGGNALFLIDSFLEDGTASYYQTPQYVPNELNLDRLLNKYGVKRNYDIVMDKQCVVNNQTQYGTLNMYYVPSLQKEQLAKNNPITSNLGYVYMLQAGSLDVSEAQNNQNVNVTVLAKSSENSWTETENIILNPLMITPPEDGFKSYDLAVLLEGKFNSAFDQKPDFSDEDENSENQQSEDSSQNSLETTDFISSSRQNGKIFVAGTSYITTYQVIDENGEMPVAMFLLNVIDYMNGNEDFCTMRTKGLSLNTFNQNVNGPLAAIFKYFNEFGLAILVAIFGLIIWNKRRSHKKRINALYNPNDSRTITK